LPKERETMASANEIATEYSDTVPIILIIMSVLPLVIQFIIAGVLRLLGVQVNSIRYLCVDA
jgi:Mg2+/Co2+ transporter CorB